MTILSRAEVEEIRECNEGGWFSKDYVRDLIDSYTAAMEALEFCCDADVARRGGDMSYEDDRIEQRTQALLRHWHSEPESATK